jgi:hypothetical protein
MKKFNVFILMMFISFLVVNAQGTAGPTEIVALKENAEKLDEGWKKGGSGSVTFNQVGQKNWAAGGDPSISFLIAATYFADYKKDKHLWQNKIGAEYGVQKVKGQSFRKNSDRFEFQTKYGYKIAEKWYIASLAAFRTQFSPTFTFDADGNRVEKISNVISPAILEVGLGIDYVPNEYFTLFMSPVASKMIFVADGNIANIAGGNPEWNIHGTRLGEKFNGQFGAMIIANYKQEVFKNVLVGSTLKLYKDYLRGPAQNIDVDWQTSIGMKINKYLAANVFTHLIYDYDVVVPNAQGENKRLQFRNIIGVGFSYNF